MSVDPIIIKQVSMFKAKIYEIHFEWTINDIDKFPWNKDRCFIRSKDLVFEEIGLKMWILFNGKRGFKYSIAEGTLKNNMVLTLMGDWLAIGPEWPEHGQFQMKSSLVNQMLIRCTVFDDKCDENDLVNDILEIESDFEKVESVGPEIGNQDDNDNQESPKFDQDSEKFDENNDHENDHESVQESNENSECRNDSKVHAETASKISEPQEVFDEEALIEKKSQVQELMGQDDEYMKRLREATGGFFSKYEKQMNDLMSYDLSYDASPDLKPLIPLPDEVEVKTGEEDEDIMFSERCKLFRYDGEWKECGIGQIKILKNKSTAKYRILMRREQIHKLCANHAIAPEMELKSTEKSNQFIWGASDFSENQMRLEKFLVRFKNDEQARRFKDAFEEAKKSTPKTPSD